MFYIQCIFYVCHNGIVLMYSCNMSLEFYSVSLILKGNLFISHTKLELFIAEL